MDATMDRSDVEAVVAQWGEPFAELAADPRLAFEDDGIVIRLWRPISVRGETIDRLRMVEPTLDDLTKMDGAAGMMGKTRRLIMSCCGLTEREVGQIGMRDLSLISRIAEAFTGAAPSTGATR